MINNSIISLAISCHYEMTEWPRKYIFSPTLPLAFTLSLVCPFARVSCLVIPTKPVVLIWLFHIIPLFYIYLQAISHFCWTYSVVYFLEFVLLLWYPMFSILNLVGICKYIDQVRFTICCLFYLFVRIVYNLELSIFSWLYVFKICLKDSNITRYSAICCYTFMGPVPKPQIQNRRFKAFVICYPFQYFRLALRVETFAALIAFLEGYLDRLI